MNPFAVIADPLCNTGEDEHLKSRLGYWLVLCAEALSQSDSEPWQAMIYSLHEDDHRYVRTINRANCGANREKVMTSFAG